MRLFIFLLISFVFSIKVWAWEETLTHPTLSETAAGYYYNTMDSEFLDKYLTIGNESLQAKHWIRRGALKEDDGTKTGYVTGTARSLYHFHDPTKALDRSGLSDMPLPRKTSTPLWAQNATAQSAATGGDWSWGAVRNYHYNYLTALNKTDADANLARMLMGLGYQMHLIQDMSQPNHVRNDTHMDDGMAEKPVNGFETWAKNHSADVAAILASPDTRAIINGISVDLTKSYEGGLAPVARLFDTRDVPGSFLLPSKSFSQGLAEYTNTNFFSEDTTFVSQYDPMDKHYFAYPAAVETDIQKFMENNLPAIPFFDINKSYMNFRISKPADQTTGEPLNCLAKPGPHTAKYYKLLGAGKFFYGSFVQDEECFYEQATKLIPRAVGYSKAMLEYFYRGKIDIELVTASSTLQHFMVKLKNSTTTNEEMTGGSIALAIKYRLRSESGGVVAPPSSTSPYYYKVVTLPGQYAIPRDQQSEQIFDLGSDPLPFMATDVTLQVIYRGQLGNEAGAVAVGMIPLIKTGTDIALSLPASGVYAKAEPNASGFTSIAVNATSASDLNQPDGYFELLIKYRTATSDPFQGVSVDSFPADYNSFSVIRANAANSVTSLVKGVPTELVFNLSTPLPLWATDVFLDLLYRRTGTPDEKPLAIGQRDISEPTPVDLFNNTDKVCINNNWYDSGSAEAYAAVGTDSFGQPLDDIFSHRLDDVSFWADASGKLGLPLNPDTKQFTAASVNPNEAKRLGYILTEYGFGYAVDEQVVPLDPRDDWTLTYQNKLFGGTGFTNQLDRGFSGMYNIRGKKIWWGTSVVYDNNEDSDTNCGWQTIPQ